MGNNVFFNANAILGEHCPNVVSLLTQCMIVTF